MDYPDVRISCERSGLALEPSTPLIAWKLSDIVRLYVGRGVGLDDSLRVCVFSYLGAVYPTVLRLGSDIKSLPYTTEPVGGAHTLRLFRSELGASFVDVDIYAPDGRPALTRSYHVLCAEPKAFALLTMPGMTDARLAARVASANFELRQSQQKWRLKAHEDAIAALEFDMQILTSHPPLVGDRLQTLAVELRDARIGKSKLAAEFDAKNAAECAQVRALRQAAGCATTLRGERREQRAWITRWWTICDYRQ